MKARQGTWGEVEPGVVIQDPKLHHWLIVQQSHDRLWLQLMNARRELVASQRRPDDTPVTIMEASETEAILLLGENMGAAVLSGADDKTLPERSLKVHVRPMPKSGRGATERIRSHIELMHEVYVGDGSTNRSIKAWHEIHDEMHEPGPIMTMAWAHHHAERNAAWTPPTELD